MRELSYQEALTEVAVEVASCCGNWPAFNSAHEAYGVLAEEFDEFWDEVKINQKRRDPYKMRAELIQIAAVATRAAAECTDLMARK